jgi:hypothetical protein
MWRARGAAGGGELAFNLQCHLRRPLQRRQRLLNEGLELRILRRAGLLVKILDVLLVVLNLHLDKHAVKCRTIQLLQLGERRAMFLVGCFREPGRGLAERSTSIADWLGVVHDQALRKRLHLPARCFLQREPP